MTELNDRWPTFLYNIKCPLKYVGHESLKSLAHVFSSAVFCIKLGSSWKDGDHEQHGYKTFKGLDEERMKGQVLKQMWNYCIYITQ